MVTDQELAFQIIHHTQDALLVHLRFMEPAFTRVTCEETKSSFSHVDGTTLFYNPYEVVTLFAREPHEISRNYLHMVLHCVFRHVFSGPTLQAPLWDLACDVAVEACIADLGLDSVYVPRVEGQQSFLAELEDALPYVTAESVYHYLVDKGVTPAQTVELRRAFFVDDHSLWIRGTRREDVAADTDGSCAQGPQSQQKREVAGQDDAGEKHDADAPPTTQGAQDTRAHDDEGTTPDVDDSFELVQDILASALSGEMGESGRTVESLERGGTDYKDWKDKAIVSDEFIEAMQSEWREIALKMDVTLDDFKHMWGHHGGGFSAALKLACVEHVNYRDFLLKFASYDEQICINNDEFDYLYYCYGLDLYGNVPLIEPLEYSDDNRVRDFVIAIDTSASTRGDMVQKFLERTYDILSDTKTFASNMNLWLIQCDAQLQDVSHIQSQQDLDAYVARLELKGLGGTDFRPVFAFVDDLVVSGQLKDLKGMLYFTDGQGTYPTQKPPYDVAFIIPDTGSTINPDVPAWAMNIQVDASDLQMEGF